MPTSLILFVALQHCIRTVPPLRIYLGQFVLAAAQSRSALVAENLFRFIHNHAKVTMACDFFVVVTA